MDEYGKNRTHLLFVYGTMMKGLINHRRIEPGIRKSFGETLTESNGFQMFSRRSEQGVIVPAVSHSVGTIMYARIYGEVYEIDGPTLAKVDAAEGHPMVYERMPVRVAGIRRMCWMYVWPYPDPDLPAAGTPAQYVEVYDDGLGSYINKYVPPSGTAENPG